MNTNQEIVLKRDVVSVQVPSGQEVDLKSGTSVVIAQALGGTFTVSVPGQGGLYRISGNDADALGLEKTGSCNHGGNEGGKVTEEAIWEQLKTCYDPEIPVNIVDLGLIYSMEMTPEGDGVRVKAKMTLTAPGCGMGTVIAGDAKAKIESLAGVVGAEVEVVWDPQWNPSMISAEGKKKLGIE